MSTTDPPVSIATPPLVAGERLDRPTFHDRYERMPPSTRAELIGGVVSMPSPLGSDHGDANGLIAIWLGHYQRATRGVRMSLNASVLLDDQAEPQPDVLLRILPQFGGRTRREGGYVSGAPELVVEIARSSRGIDLGPKLQDYERGGVLEYLVIALDPEVFWFVRRANRFVRLAPGPDGWLRSAVFPGLWLDPRAVFDEWGEDLIPALDQGLACPEHARFVAQLAEAERRIAGSGAGGQPPP